ncbi:partial Type IV pilus biogenesis and competence protein PilQ, partial [Planctomycetaceae bacterium]
VSDIESRMEAITQFMESLKAENTARLQKTPLNDPLVVRTYETNRDVTDAEFRAGLASILSADGKVVTNADRNSVIVYDHQSQFKNIDAFFAAIDAEAQQVLLTSKLCEVTLDNYIGYGLQIFTEHGAQNLNNGRFSGDSFGTSAQTVGNMFGQTTGFGPFVGTFLSDRVNVTLEMLANDGKVETLIMPTSMVSNKKTAKITVGQEVPYLQTSAVTGGVAQVTVAFKEIATIMEVTPTILGNGLVRLDIRFTIKEQIGTISIQQNDTPILSNRESITNVFVKDGETLVVGGLIRERERNQENGIPFLKDIPLLGYLFKSKNKRIEKTDLLFFLRPTIVTQGARGPSVKDVSLEREYRPQVWDDDDILKLKLVGSELTKPGAMPKPAHYDTGKRPKTVKDVNPNE